MCSFPLAVCSRSSPLSRQHTWSFLSHIHGRLRLEEGKRALAQSSGCCRWSAPWRCHSRLAWARPTRWWCPHHSTSMHYPNTRGSRPWKAHTHFSRWGHVIPTPEIRCWWDVWSMGYGRRVFSVSIWWIFGVMAVASVHGCCSSFLHRGVWCGMSLY